MTNKDLLFIFDNRVDMGKTASLLARNGVKQVDLFPLTGDPSALQEVEAGLRREGFGGFFKYDTSAIIDEQVACLREKICKWSVGIGETRIGRKSVKEWFILPGCNVSAWWFSLFAEKNPFKTDAFLRISQVHSVEYALKKKEYGLILLVTGNKGLKSAVRNVAGKSAIPVLTASPVKAGGFKGWLKKSAKNFSLFTEVLKGFKHYFEFLRCKYLAASYLPSRRKRFNDSASILFVSYFPLLEKRSLRDGIFRNRYALALQEKLIEAGLPITWIFIYVPIDGFSFKDAARAANRFVAKGEKIFFLEEFLSLKDALLGLFLWARQIFIGLFLFRPVKKALVSGPIGIESMPFMKSLWSESFYGPIGLGGILFTLAFRRMFKAVKNVSDCLYFLEMLPWEHALNSAKNREQSNIRSIGFQHSSVPINSFNYFYDRSETLRTGNYTDLPLPDIIGCNGEVPLGLMEKSGYPALTRLESLRYLYFDEILSAPVDPGQKRRTLLIAGSGDKKQSIRQIMLVRSVFPKAEAFDICFKGHPYFPFEKLFKELGIDAKESGYIVDNGDISTILNKAFAVVTLSSTVTIEALAFGCEVIVPVFPDSISLHPLVGFEKYYHKVTNKEGLANAVERILSGHSLCDIREYRDFVRKYWDIDKDIPRWLKLLNVTASASSDNSNTVLLRR